MKLNFEEEAYNYIIKKADSIYIYIDSIKGRCVYVYNDPSKPGSGKDRRVSTPPKVKTGKPEVDQGDFREESYKDLTVYISEEIEEAELEDKTIVLKRKLGVFNKIDIV